ncbi:MAG: TIGR04211 family SH3 domain-containing protein [Pseudomonadota bacterium]
MRALLFGLLLMVASAPILAETVYVSDTLRVGVRDEPGGDTPAKSIVVSGMELEVLESRGNFLRIRTRAGEEGWVNSAYTTRQVPARLRVDQMEETIEGLETEKAELEEQLNESHNQQAALAQEIAKLERQRDDLREQLEEARAERAPGEGTPPWWVWVVGVLAIFGVGFGVGAVWYRRILIGRLHGLSP